MRDHAPRHFGRTLKVVGCARRHLPHEHFFGDTSAEQHRNVLQNFLAIHAETVFRRATALSRLAHVLAE